MYNILHLASSRGMGDAMRRTPRHAHPVAQPPGASHLTLIVTDPDPAGARSRRRTEAHPPPPRPQPHRT